MDFIALTVWKRTMSIRESRAFYRKIGICPVCRKNKLYGDEKNCLDCRGKYALRYRNAIDKKSETEKIEFNSKRNAVARERYKQRKEKGICTMCGKRKAAPSKAKCEICLEKNRILKKKAVNKNA